MLAVADADLVLVARFTGNESLAVVPVKGQHLAGGAVIDFDVDRLSGEGRQGARQCQAGGCPDG